MAKPRDLYAPEKAVSALNCPPFLFVDAKRSKQLDVFDSGWNFGGGGSQCTEYRYGMLGWNPGATEKQRDLIE